MEPIDYQIIVIKKAPEMYAKHGMQVNRAYTPRAMIAKAEELTGQKFNRDYLSAARALGQLLEQKGFPNA
jgi:hypothetical protein